MMLCNVVLRTFINKGFLLIIALTPQFMLIGVFTRWGEGFPKLNSTAAKWGETRWDTRFAAIITNTGVFKGGYVVIYGLCLPMI